MIFPDFYNVNVKSKIKSIFKYKHKLYYNFNDQPAHGACSLINLQFLKKLAGIMRHLIGKMGTTYGIQFYLKNLIFYTLINLYFFIENIKKI